MLASESTLEARDWKGDGVGVMVARSGYGVGGICDSCWGGILAPGLLGTTGVIRSCEPLARSCGHVLLMPGERAPAVGAIPREWLDDVGDIDTISARDSHDEAEHISEMESEDAALCNECMDDECRIVERKPPYGRSGVGGGCAACICGGSW